MGLYYGYYHKQKRCSRIAIFGLEIFTMTTIRDEKPTSLPAFLELVEKFQTSVDGSLWFRGCGVASYKLLPTLYRHKDAKTPDKVAGLEQKLMARFRQRSIPYHNRPLDQEWNTLFFMQHYGIPTRLLDWTENPLIALHFALMSAPYKRTAKGMLKFNNNATVWILDPVKWNQRALDHQSYTGGALTPGDEALSGYSPKNTSFTGMNRFPVALYGEHNSPRIVAQQGVFTIFGQIINPMEKMFVDYQFPQDSLVRITIKNAIIDNMRNSLLRHGITESVVYPDLEGLAMEIKRSFGF